MLRHRIQLRQRIHLRIMKVRRRLAARHIPRIHLRIPRPHSLRQPQPLVTLMPRAEQQLKLRIILLKKRLDVSLQPRFRPMQRLQHAHRRQKRRRRPILPPLPHPKAHGSRDHHQAIDRGGDRTAHRDPKQYLKQQTHLTLAYPPARAEGSISIRSSPVYRS